MRENVWELLKLGLISAYLSVSLSAILDFWGGYRWLLVSRLPFPVPRSRFSDILLVRFFRSSTLTESLAKAKDFQDCLFPSSIADWLVALQTDEKSNLSTESFIVNCKTNLRLIIVRKKNRDQDRELFLRYSVLSPQSTGPKLNKIWPRKELYWWKGLLLPLFPSSCSLF